MITIVDYGAGNLPSVENALAAIGAPSRRATEPRSLAQAQRIILPGVGHFGQMMRSLRATGLEEALLDRIQEGVPFLGICLGMQALFERSEEGENAGFGILPGQVRKFPGDARVPHIGWNTIEPRPGSRLLSGISDGSYVYFAHSYHAPLGPETAATCAYALPFAAALEKGSVFGVQFHPEKSGETGLRILKTFAGFD